MLDPKTIEAEIAILNNLLDGLRDQKMRLLICMTVDALKWALEGSETEPPSKMLSLVRITRPYLLSGNPPEDTDLN
jgi:hypothetical protein